MGFRTLPLEGESFRPNIALPVILLALCAGIGVTGYRYYEGQRRGIEREIQNQLSAIADLKVQQILAWRQERIADAILLAEDPMVAALPSAQRHYRLQNWLEAFRKVYGYTEVSVLDRTGNVRNAASDLATATDSSVLPLIAAALRTGEVAVSDLHERNGSIYLDFLAPVPSGNDLPSSGVVFLRMEASAFESMLVQAWPTSSRTAECLLVRREGNGVRYLTDLLHENRAALRMVRPLGSDLPAAMAARGMEGVHYGLDYRGVPVMAALRQVPGTPWALVAKMDTEEIYSPLLQRSITIGLVVGLLLAGSLTTLGLLWNLQRSRFYRRQHQADLERRALAGRYAHLSRCVNDIVLLMDESARIVEANDRAVTTYGYSFEELQWLSMRDLLDPSELPGHPAIWATVEEKDSIVLESVHRRKDGSALQVEVSSRKVDMDGRKFHQSVVRDITERKRVERELRRATRATRVLSASNQALVRSRDEADLFRAICDAITSTGGYPLAWIGFAENDGQKSVRKVAVSGPAAEYLDSHSVAWADQPLGRGPAGTCIRAGRVAVCNDVETDAGFQPWREKAAFYGFKSVIGLPLYCEGATIGALTIYASEPDAFRHEEMSLLQELAGDLSYGIQSHRRRLEQARAEEEILRSAMEFRTLFDSANDAIFIMDLEGRILEINEVACRHLGYSREELVHKTVNDIESPACRASLPVRRAQLVERGESLFEISYLRKDGAELPVEISSRLFDYRQAPAILSVARDISGRKKAEAEASRHAAELERAKTDAENASRAKSEFLANMSHEIRTPMNGILGMSGLLLDTVLNDDQRDCAETIRRSTGALLGILNGVLDLSKIEAGRMELEPSGFDIVACLEEIGELMAPQARIRGLEYVFQAQVEHRWVCGDAGRLRQIVLNLLGNAIKFTDRGQVKLAISNSELSASHATFNISVADTGIGIAAAELPLLFNNFTQVDSSPSKRHEGTGLGLAISRRLAQLMAGTLTVASELGKGTTFVLTLPLPLTEEVDRLNPSPLFECAQIAAKSRRILIAEDNTVNQKIAVRLLEKCGCRVDLAANGREAVDMAGRFPYDLIFMDCGMPEMDGYAASRAIRARSNGSHVPIVALTAHAIAGTREQCIAAGMDDYIAKPVSIAGMQQMLLKWSP